MTESRKYKHSDYSVRASDPYAVSKYRIIMNWLPKDPGLRVLNAGCGSGEMSSLLAQRASWHIDAIDIDPEAIRLSQQIKESQGLANITVTRASIEDHPGRDYDVIISNDVLEHIENDTLAMEKLSEMLVPGGILCISVPALQWLFGQHDEMLGHYRRYSRRILMARLSVCFDVTRCRYFGAMLIPIAILYSQLFRRAYPVGKQRGNSIMGRVLSSMLGLEQIIPFPIGTSLIAMATLPAKSNLNTNGHS